VPWAALNRKRGSILSKTFPDTRRSRRTLAAEKAHGDGATACELTLILQYYRDIHVMIAKTPHQKRNVANAIDVHATTTK
jgi:hypothetical protein